jgi:transcriptional regulator with XRE-family HTH domain
MKIEPHLSDDQVLQLIGHRLARLRLTKNLTQNQVSEQAGLGLRTVQRLESGAAATQLSGFIRVCRVLGLVGRLDALLPEDARSPIAQLKLQAGKRQRASGHQGATSGPTKWKWGKQE